ncbi:hypothetical protein KCP70_03030 [Salmonella enterica subsp. enterica]|nr:hypothetical protein KCP70_03030 [Salmonella enterica subsp. enterica]
MEFLRDVSRRASHLYYRKQRSTARDNRNLLPVLLPFILLARTLIDKDLRPATAPSCEYVGNLQPRKIAREWEDIWTSTCSIPIPETSCDIAPEIARGLGKPYRRGFVKNRYVDVPLSCRANSYAVNPRRKLNA